MSASASPRRLEIVVRGIVQGIGFRPSVAVAARARGLGGAIRNTVRGVTIEVEGAADAVEAFRAELLESGPLAPFVAESEIRDTSPRGETTFSIAPSTADGERAAWITPDLATCDDCVRELRDPSDRRHRYPFLSCARCGPRWTILERIPFDRGNTAMRLFPMCEDCRAEYDDPTDRRYHAQTISCARCGPRLALLDGAGAPAGDGEEALARAAALVREGGILAVLGLGGFQLVVDATDGAAVARLRARKRRPDKPFAVMLADLDAVDGACVLEDEARALLRSPQSPIVLLRRRVPGSGGIDDAVAPGNPNLGVMVPTTGLHHLLADAVARPVVATSGNESGDPICTATDEALVRLRDVADAFLVHDRPVRRPVDDSVVRVVDGGPLPIRVARGWAPLTRTVPGPPPPPVLAVGGHLKNTIALASGRDLVLSQHIGELEAPASRALLARLVEDFTGIYGVRPVAVARDLHPDWASTHVARAQDAPGIEVQHHHAHVVAAMVEHDLDGPVLGIAWDGTGYGPDGTIWGGEFLRATRSGFRRVARLRPFPLPGGEAAIRAPRRTALGCDWSVRGPAAADGPIARGLPEPERRVVVRMLERGLHCPVTSAAGRLFDAAAAILGLRERVTFEGQAAMDVEFAAAAVPPGRSAGVAPAPVEVVPDPVLGGTGPDGPWMVDWTGTLDRLVADAAAGRPAGESALAFQRALVAGAVEVCRRAGEPRIVLTGGCFQNRALAEELAAALRAEGFQVFTHRRVPPNDGGLALGQLGVALARLSPED